MENKNNNYEVTADGKQILKKINYVGVRRAIGNNLTNTWQSTPLVSGFIKVDAGNVIELKNRLKEKNSNVTYTAVFVKLLSSAIERHPIINASLIEKKIEVYKSVNVGIAVGTPDELLLVPVVHNAEEKNVFEIADEIKELTRKVIEKTITEEELSGGTVTMSSMGMYESWGMAQILVPPQTIIFGFGSIRNEPVALPDDSVGIRPIMHISSTSDHRVLQGEPVSKFLAALMDNFKEPGKYMGL